MKMFQRLEKFVSSEACLVLLDL